MSAVRLRADAARNVSKILDAAYVASVRTGSAPSMEQVAEAAGVGIATVYRRFPSRSDLLRGVLERRWDEVVAPALRHAVEDPDARAGLRLALEGAVRFVADDRAMLNVAADLGLMTTELARRFCEPVAGILDQGQRDGVFRPDLMPDDIPRFVSMLFGVLGTIDPESDGWERYMDLMLDLITATQSEVAPVTPVHAHRPVLPPGRRGVQP